MIKPAYENKLLCISVVILAIACGNLLPTYQNTHSTHFKQAQSYHF